MKVKQCLAYMKSDRSAGSRKAKYYKSKGEYNVRRDKIRSLQQRDLIPPILDPDLFLDILQDEEKDDNIAFCAEVSEDRE